ncbi:MAG: hypothetical protein H6742_12755 [Alphaproteobacteria bacterium]|nr:hypothetical protein [Alphaproteobacteria bacterium]
MSGLLWLLGSVVLAKGVAPDSPARVAAPSAGTLMRWAATQDQTVKLLTPDGVK